MTTRLQTLREQFLSGVLEKSEYIDQALNIHRNLFNYAEVVKSTDVREINITAVGVCFVMGNERIKVYAPSEEARVAPIEAMNFGSYEPEETKVMDLLSVGATTIIDVGANIGWHAIRFAIRHPDARVFAFEPIPQTYTFLQRNVAANNVGDRVHCYNYGLSEKNAGADFFIAPTCGTNASMLNVAGTQNARKIAGLTTTLDQWCTNLEIIPEFIKCDVEGAELLVFRGGTETIQHCKPVVFTEMLRKWTKPFAYHPNDLIAFFRALGYRCFAVGAHGVRNLEEIDDGVSETNYAFVHERHHRVAIEALESLSK